MTPHLRDRPRAGRRASIIAAALLCAAAGARAQEAPPDDPEARKLREEAEAALEGGGGEKPPVDEGERLRRAAAAETEDQSKEMNQLLQAYYAVANRLNAFNPRITAIGDFVGRLSASSAETVMDGRNIDDRFSLREFELDLRADIDPYAKGVLILAFEELGGGEYEADVEEGYLTLETLPLGFHAQLGRFKVPFGQINRLHDHDLPWTTKPYATTDVFGDDGFIEQGVLVTWLAPAFPLELTAAVLNGENDTILAGGDSDDPAWLGRAQAFFQLGDTAFATFGTSYLFGYNDAPSPVDDDGKPERETHLWGADVLLKWQPSQFHSLVVLGEVYHLRREVGGPGDREFGFGGFAAIQLQPFQRWYVGVRYDWSNYDMGVEDAEQYAVGGWVSFYTTEFLRFRVGYEHRERQQSPDLDTVYFQVTFVFGSHPVEPFWFNR